MTNHTTFCVRCMTSYRYDCSKRVLKISQLSGSKSYLKSVVYYCGYARVMGRNRNIAVYIRSDVLRDLLNATRCVLCAQNIKSQIFTITPPRFLYLLNVDYTLHRSRLAHVTLYMLSYDTMKSERDANYRIHFLFNRGMCAAPCNGNPFRFLREIYGEI